MPKYNISVPRARGIQPSSCDVESPAACTRDMVIHALLGRFAEEDGKTWELETIFNPLVNAIDIDVPLEVLESIETVGVGPNLQRYMHWLHPVAGENIIPGPTEVTDLIVSEGHEKWDDIRVAASASRAGVANPPSFTKVGDDGAGSIGVFAMTFTNAIQANENQVFFQVQLPHGWKEGSSIFPHIHWMPTTAGSGTVRWGLEYTWVNPFEKFPDTTIIYGTSDAFDDVEDYHTITRVGDPDNGMDAVGKTLSSMLNCRLFRNSDIDTYADGAAFLEFDFHYRIDSLGSDQEFIKEYAS